jgi:hypothetical protein
MRPQVRIPLVLAAAIPAAAYALRSVIRGVATPDLPGDAVVLVLVVVALLAGARYGSAAQRRREELPGEVQDSDRGAGKNREHHEVR